MLSDEEKNSMELDIEAKYVGRTEKEFLNNVTYDECLYILDTKNKYCDDIKNLSLLKIVDIVNEQSKEIEELKEENEKYKNPPFFDEDKYIENDKIKAKIEELDLAVFKNQTIYTVNKMQEIKFARLCLAELLEKE